MPTSKDESTVRFTLFANTGVHIVCTPLSPDIHHRWQKAGAGWQYCRCGARDDVVQYGFIQWQVVHSRLFLAIDTTTGKNAADVGTFATSLASDFHLCVTGLLGPEGAALEGVPPIELVIRQTNGEPKDAHMVVDFGHRRTGVLLVEHAGMQEPIMTLLPLTNRLRLDAWDEEGVLTSCPRSCWFSSRACWCTPPYLPAEPGTFEDFSMVRLGDEADDLEHAMRREEDGRSGLSSPIRYLWDNNGRCLEGADWCMADPFERYTQFDRVAKLKGPLLAFIPEDDATDDPLPVFEQAPPRPQHAPRTLMIGAMYELLCQAYSFVNSPSYQRRSGVNRIRSIRSLTLTYPANMIPAERALLRQQALKAVRIFMRSLGKNQAAEPIVNLGPDNASAVQLTYIWDELQKLGCNPDLWLARMGLPHQSDRAQSVIETPADGPTARQVRKRSRKSAERAQASPREVRIASIDIGGGTSDLAIARYTIETKAGGSQLNAEVAFRSGVAIGGDHLVKRLLEDIIVPQLAYTLALDANRAYMLFGREIPYNRALRGQRIYWLNQMLVPLAHAYLQNAVEQSERSISHTDPTIVDQEVVRSLQDAIDQLWPFESNCDQELGLVCDPIAVERLVNEVFGNLLYDFCEMIVEHKVDLVVLAGQLTMLPHIRHLIKTFLPLPESQIVSMYGRDVGAWYPDSSKDDQNSGRIADPKSCSVVGAAIDFLARHGMPRFRIRMNDESKKQSYCWGLISESRIEDHNILFDRELNGFNTGKGQLTEIEVSHPCLLIGRKRRSHANAPASPVYELKVTAASPSRIHARIGLERRRGTEGEEELAIVFAEGTVADAPAILGENVFLELRTLDEVRFYLDSGSLDKLDLSELPEQFERPSGPRDRSLSERDRRRATVQGGGIVNGLNFPSGFEDRRVRPQIQAEDSKKLMARSKKVAKRINPQHDPATGYTVSAASTPQLTPLATERGCSDPASADAGKAVQAIDHLRRSRGRESLRDATADAVDCTVFAPSRVATSETFLLQVFAHMPEMAEEAKGQAIEFDEDTSRRGSSSLETEIQRGSRLEFHLVLPQLEVDDPVRHLVWRGRTTAVQFSVAVTPDVDLGSLTGTVNISQDSVPIGKIAFKIKVVEDQSVCGDEPTPNGKATSFETFFISYASEDRSEVIKRVQMLERLGKKFYQDLLDLEPGDRWERKLYQYIDDSDAVLVFWSSRASRSEWVLRECRYAIETKGIDHILPVIIEGPPPAPPPEELKGIHMNDRLIYFICD